MNKQPTKTRAAMSTPTLLHITHWKAGSQWVKKIFVELFGDRLVPELPDNAEFLQQPVRAGGVYSPLYISKWQYDGIAVPADAARLVVIRDLRDTLVSMYFSFKGPHPEITETGHATKAVLNTLGLEDGLVYLLYETLPTSTLIQQSWLAAGQKCYHYEDLLEHDVEIFTEVFAQLGLAIDSMRLRSVVEANRFEKITGGRARGQEDLTAHERKGIAGDWRNHFTDRVKFLFKLQYGQLLIDAGYERDLNW